MNNNNRILLIVGAVLLIFVVIFAGVWIGADTGAVTKRNEVLLRKQSIYTAYLGRYDKVQFYTDAINSADQQILSQITLLTEARVAFAQANNNLNFEQADDQIEVIENTFISLVSYMEQNPSNWTTLGITEDFIQEFSASTNMITNAIETYNEAVTDYHNHIEVIPNRWFLGSYTHVEFYQIPSLSTVIPS
ncbi:LemA family protein [Acholeplasma equirhinis]|uniref:LemA family protein n=1 Tax=Acholeplasma equirhinis TaxID=555393 RepID=UPI00197A717B|nr:LemA family protein [Acholeplasma equirhinis]MBN3490452.1 LemA family protein [Acholeplasma equirhinis]